jgi:glycosyltransferase involved in cell wall biosynthesis
VVATIHDLWPLDPRAVLPWRSHLLFRFLLARILARADDLIVPSIATADELRAYGWTGPLAVVPHGIAPCHSIPPRPPEAPTEPYLLTLGAIDPRKNLLAMAGGLPSVPWIHLGGVRHDPGGVISRGLRSSGCRMLGQVSEADRLAWMAHTALLVQPSVAEGFGYPVLEAMAMGVPVMAFRAGALPEILGDAAWWSSDSTLRDDVRVCMADVGARRDLGEAGRLRVEKFTLSAMAEGHRSVYEGKR